MNPTILATSVTVVCSIILLLGITIGVIRGVKRSAVRLVFAVLSAIVAFFVAPALSQAVLKLDISFANINIGGHTVYSVQDLITQSLLQVPYLNDLAASSPTFNQMLVQIPTMLVNVVSFVVLYFAVKYVSMIFYWILWAIFFKRKKDENGKPIPQKMYRFPGAILGFAAAVVTMIVVLIPTFGLINTASSVLKEMNTTSTTVQTTTYDTTYGTLLSSSSEAENPNNSTNNTEEILSSAEETIQNFQNSFIAKAFTTLGVETLSNNAFTTLTTVEIQGEKVTFKNEAVCVAKVYRYIPDIQKIDFNAIQEKDLETLDNIVDAAFSSTLLSKVVEEIVPAMAESWLDETNPTFAGISKPVIQDADAQLLFDELLKLLADTDTTNRESIKTDLHTFIGLVGVLGDENNNILASILQGNTENILDQITANNTISKLVLKLSESLTLTEMIPDVLNYGLKQVYKAMNITNTEGLLVTVDPTTISWETESLAIEDIIVNMIQTMEGVDATGIENLDDPTLISIGTTLNNIVHSQLLGNISKNLILELLTSMEAPEELKNIVIESNLEEINFAELLVDLKQAVEAISATIDELNAAINNGFTQENISNILDALKDVTIPASVLDVVKGELDKAIADVEESVKTEANAIVAVADIILANTIIHSADTEASIKQETLENLQSTMTDVLTNIVASQTMQDVMMGYEIDVNQEIQTMISTTINNPETNFTTEQQEAIAHFFKLEIGA